MECEENTEIPVEADNSWQQKMTTTLERDVYILKNEMMTDCEVVVGSDKLKESFKCHRIYLAKASPVLASMLYKGKSQPQTIYLPGIKPFAFKEVLGYIYTDSINQMGWEEIEDVARAAKYLDLPHLMTACLTYLVSLINVSNACPLFELAQQAGDVSGAAQLAQKSFQVMCDNAARVLEEPSFEQISLKTLTALLKQDNLHVSSDIPLIEACIKWAKEDVKCRGKLENPQNLREVLGPAFSLLRFLSLSPAQFATFQGKSDLLTTEESLAILSNISCPGIAVLPSEICKTMETRHGYIFGHGCVFPCQPSMDNKFFSSGNPQWCEFSFSFEVNSDLILYGAQIGSQIHSDDGNGTCSMISDTQKCQKRNGHIPLDVKNHDNKLYREDLDITFEKPKPRSRVAMHFDAVVQYNSLISMKFDKPFLILKGETYKLYVHLRKQGWYPTGASFGGMRPLGAELSFHSNKENFFHSLVFMR